MTSIGEESFCGCSGLTAVTLGSSVTTIGDGAFSGCDGMISVYYAGDIAG
ncbi:MAG: leucine-rich repeat protein [Bacteroidales bacterium]|nr:leucine-rich repeat protein [Bacteroidales bacterium]